jgi:threonine/homoserine/homoserine lactone efflux protein
MGVHRVALYRGGYLLYLAWKIATSSAMSDDIDGKRKPMTFLAAAVFQWVNPKAWVMALGAITTYTPAEGYFTNVLVIAVVFAAVNLPSVCVWAGVAPACAMSCVSPAG